MRAIIRASYLRDAYELAPNLRAADRRECEGWSIDPLDSLIEAHVSGIETYTAVGEDGDVLCMFGLGCTHPSWIMTTVWLLGTDALTSSKYRREFIAFSTAWIDRFMTKHGTLGNMVHSENTIHIGWLKRLHFDINTQYVITSPRGDVYYPFIRSRTACVT